MTPMSTIRRKLEQLEKARGKVAKLEAEIREMQEALGGAVTPKPVMPQVLQNLAKRADENLSPDPGDGQGAGRWI